MRAALLTFIITIMAFTFTTPAKAKSPKRFSPKAIFLHPGDIAFILPAYAQTKRWDKQGLGDFDIVAEDMDYYGYEAVKYLKENKTPFIKVQVTKCLLFNKKVKKPCWSDFYSLLSWQER
ncbi:hypothetical protein HMPREF3034_02210 [Prevotella sp. DNF00663]|uniref:hypothetical protein n=1 Tax=Prevotella sp. DNF00663 TaxID=1384078 RepID=UPI0007811770|nr:hypothetical protein [Prevotella sp. DNF00663]KXB79211.1 hypothetical protein HMPREF3034_02210 [Prevotella sp. DNF00663]